MKTVDKSGLMMSDDSTGLKTAPPYMGVLFATCQDIKSGKNAPKPVQNAKKDCGNFSVVIHKQPVDNFQHFQPGLNLMMDGTPGLTPTYRGRNRFSTLTSTYPQALLIQLNP